MRRLIVALHDVTPSTARATETWRAVVARRADGPVALLVVPRYGGTQEWPETVGLRWVHWRMLAGDEIALHGLTHTTVTGQDGPELRGRDSGELMTRIVDGSVALARVGLPVVGFVAPAYAHPAGAHDGCRRAGFTWWATRWQLHWDGGYRWLPSIGLGASTPTKRVLSPAALTAGIRALARYEVVRLDLHPADLEHRALAGAGVRALEALLAQGRRLVTHGDLVRGGPAVSDLRVDRVGRVGARVAASPAHA